MLGNGHVRFGGRVGETDRRQRRHRAPARPDLVCSASPHRFASLQYTTFVFSGCSSRPRALSRSAICTRNRRACASVSQWMTMSSA